MVLRPFSYMQSGVLPAPYHRCNGGRIPMHGVPFPCRPIVECGR